MKRNLFAVVAMAYLGLFAFSSPVSASVSQCNYAKTYNDPKTLYVARDGSGNFNCDGTNDEVEINAAFQAVKNSGGAYSSVFLKSGTYVIGTKVNMVSSSVFEGDKDAVLKLKDQADWVVNVPMIGVTSTNINNLEIKCFEVDVNYAGNYSADAYSCMAGGKTCASGDTTCCEAYSTARTTGKGYYNVAGFTYGSNYSMHDMYLHDGLNDGLNVTHGNNTKFYDNVVYKLGHEGLYVKYSDTAEAYGNKITNRTNSGLRADDTNHVSFHNNDITAFDNWSAGGPGIEIVKDDRIVVQMNDIQIYNNYIHGTYGPGIWITASGTNYTAVDLAANIHHNIFSGVGINPTINWTAGILTAGFYNLDIENNVFDKTYNGALIISNAVATAPATPTSNYVTTFRNNIVTGTLPQRSTTSQGYGIINKLSVTHTVNSENNCYYGNVAGNFSGTVSSTNDIFADPLYADAANYDYHLQSASGRWNGSSWVKDLVTSPCIDAGYAASPYSLEPSYNGGRIDIGRYGNTAEASLSPLPANSTYTLAVNGGSGSGSYVYNQAVTVIANTATTGKVFDQWTGDTSRLTSAVTFPTATVIMPAGAVSLTATYKNAYYTLAVTGGSGSGSYVYNQAVTVIANTAATGKVFDQWTGDTSRLTSAVTFPTASVTMPAGAIALIATYKATPVANYQLTVVGGSGSGAYAVGTVVTIKATAQTGKVFAGWTGSTAYLSSTTSATATVTMPAKAITLTATYRAAYYLTVYGGSGSGWYAYGTKVTIVANAPAAGKAFSKWTGSTGYVAWNTSSTTTVTMPSNAISLTATYVTRWSRW